MKKWNTCALVVVTLTILTANSACSQQLRLLKKSRLAYYPSASALEYINGRLYVIGDDATWMLVLNKAHQIVDSIPLFSYKGKRIAKEEKTDLESAALYSSGNKHILFAFGSVSTDRRNKILVYNTAGNKEVSFQSIPSSFYHTGLPEMNVEGAAFVKGKLLLANRANNTHRDNHLLLVPFSLENGLGKQSKIISVQMPGGKIVTGISGLYYVAQKDLLLFTASEEDTPNAFKDGTIGNSYIGYIKNVSAKLSTGSVKADSLIKISGIIDQKQLPKIESLAVEKITGNYLVLHLAADNDNGESVLYKVRWKMKF